MNETFRIGVTPDMTPAARTAIETAIAAELGDLPGIEWEVMKDAGPIADPALIDKYDSILALGLRFTQESFDGLKRLLHISRWGVGYDRLDVKAATQAGVLISITPEAIRRPVAEGILAMMFALAKRLVKLDQITRRGEWRTHLPHGMICLEGRTLGSIGLGNIAGEMFRMARGMGMGRLLAYDPYINKEAAQDLNVELADLETVMRHSDFIAVNCFLNEETRGLVNAEALSWMKPTAFLINTARGPVIDEAALYDALKEHRIAGAGLDVFEVEPPPPDNPLFQLDNVLLAPHAVAWTVEALRDNSLYACRNIHTIYHGEIPQHTVNRAVVERTAFQSRLERRRQ